MKAFFKRKIRIKDIAIFIAVTLLIAGCAFAAVSIFGGDTKTVGASAFSVGGLDENGEYIETETSVFTDELIECQGLKIEPDFKSAVSYRVYLYNSAKKLIEVTPIMRSSYKLTNTFAKYCRIMIIPDESTEKDYSIGFFQISGIVKNLEITVNKKQNFTLKNYFNPDDDKENSIAINSDGKLGYTDKEDFGCTAVTSVGAVEEFTVTFPGNTQSEGAEILFFTADSSGTTYTYVSTVTLDGSETAVTVAVPEGATHFVVNYSLAEELVINQAQ